MLMRIFLASALALIQIPALQAQHAPLPAKLVGAKTAFLVNDGTWSKAYDKFYAELKKWNRFQFVESRDQADIMIVLSTKPGELTGAVPVLSTGGSATSGVVIGGSESKFYIRITDGKDGTPLWSDVTGEAMLVSNSPKKLVSNLRKRMEKE